MSHPGHAQKYDNPERNEASARFSEQLKADLPLTKETVIFDFGAGTGRVTIPLLGDVSKVIFEDKNENMLKQCQENLDAQPHKNYELFHGEISQYNGKADIIVASMVVHHIDDVEELLKIFLSKLNPHGILVVCDFLPGASFFQLKPPIPHYGFVPEEFCQLLTKVGFVKTQHKDAAPLNHIYEDGKKDSFARFAVYAEAP